MLAELVRHPSAKIGMLARQSTHNSNESIHGLEFLRGFSCLIILLQIIVRDLLARPAPCTN